MSENTRTCGCTTQQFSQIIFNNVAYQNAANTVYQAKNLDYTSAISGIRAAPNGNPIFKTNAERMQYLMGRQNQASCGVPRKTFTLG
jgi:hypothetical protein